MTQITAEETYDTSAMPGAQRRMVKRVTVDFPAALHTVLCKLEGKIADISPKGAKLKVGAPIEVAGSARLLIEGQEVFCDVIWSDGEACGVKFERELSEDLLATIMKDAVERFAPVACASWIPMGTKRGGRLVCEG